MKFSFSFTNKVGRLLYIHNQLNEIVSRKSMIGNSTVMLVMILIQTHIVETKNMDVFYVDVA